MPGPVSTSPADRMFPTMGTGQLSDPFSTILAAIMPRDLERIFDLMDSMWANMHILRSACERLSSYFITNLVVDSDNAAIAEKYRNSLLDDHDLVEFTTKTHYTYWRYGNAFITRNRRFRRSLMCPHCSFSFVLTGSNLQTDWSFDAGAMTFNLKRCPQCGRSGAALRSETYLTTGKVVQPVLLDPRNVIIDYNEIADASAYYYKVPADIVQAIRDGDPLVLATTPWEYVIAACQHRLLYMHPEQFLHLKADAPIGMKMYGWGLPPFVLNMNPAYHAHLLNKVNEAFCLDWIVPMRLFYPDQIAGNVEVGNLVNMELMRSELQAAIQRKRQDPTSIACMPFPVGYKTYGGEGMQTITHDMQDAAERRVLNGINCPVEFYQNTVQVRAQPMMLRAMERSFPWLISNQNKLAAFIGRGVGRCNHWPDVKISWQSITSVDSEEQKQIALQLASNGMISQGSALSAAGYSYPEEQRKLNDEKIRAMVDDAENQAKSTEIMDSVQAQQAMSQQAASALALGALQSPPPGSAAPAGQPPADPSQSGGDPAAAQAQAAPVAAANPWSGPTATIDQLVATAQQIAQQIYATPDRTQALDQIKQGPNGDALHAQVLSALREMDKQVSSGAIRQARGLQ